MNKKRKIIMDVDTGTDDAIAIMLACLSEELDILGICTVNGNRSVEITTENTLRVLDFLKKDIPVFKGCRLPYASTLIKGRRDGIPIYEQGEKSDNIHRDYLDLPKAKTQEKPMNAVSWLVETLMGSEEKITLVPVGPLTNIATALRIEPEIAEKVQEIMIMGGAYEEGNVTPYAEFNFWVDPEAAKIVLDSGCRITLVPLDATHTGTISEGVIHEMEKLDTEAGKIAAGIILERLEGFRRLYTPDTYTVPVHDALAVAALINPDVLEVVKKAHVDVDISGGDKDGMCICAFDDERRFNVSLALKGNSEEFAKVLLGKFSGI